MVSFVNFEHISEPFSSVSIVVFEQVNVCWVRWWSYEGDKIAQKGRHEKILNSYFVYKVIIVCVSGAYHLITKGMVRELITFLKDKKICRIIRISIKNCKIIRWSRNLHHNKSKKNIIKGVIPAKLKLSTIVNYCDKGKELPFFVISFFKKFNFTVALQEQSNLHHIYEMISSIQRESLWSKCWRTWKMSKHAWFIQSMVSAFNFD